MGKPHAWRGGPERWPLSVDVFREQGEGRLQQDLDVQPQRPLIDVIEVLGDPALHLFHGLGFAAMPGDLCQPGDARLEPMPRHVGAHLAGVIDVVGDRVGARADERHVAEQHVEPGKVCVK